MNDELLDEYAKKEIPPVPDSFDLAVHERVNHSLLLFHLLDFLLRATTYAAWQFGRALLGVVTYSLKGDYGTRRDERSP